MYKKAQTPTLPSESKKDEPPQRSEMGRKWAGIRATAEMANKERAASSASHLSICPKTGVSINGDAMGWLPDLTDGTCLCRLSLLYVRT